jgi:hypothetical protein
LTIGLRVLFVDVEREKRCGHWVVGEEKLRYNKTHKHQT